MKKLATLLGITVLVAAAACGSQEEADADRMDQMTPSSEMDTETGGMDAGPMAEDSMAADTTMEEGMPEEMMDEGAPDDGMGGGVEEDGMGGAGGV